jgi:hypothetical protein
MITPGYIESVTTLNADAPATPLTIAARSGLDYFWLDFADVAGDVEMVGLSTDTEGARITSSTLMLGPFTPSTFQPHFYAAAATSLRVTVWRS